MQHAGDCIMASWSTLKTEREAKLVQTCCYPGQTALTKLFYLRFHLKPVRVWLLRLMDVEFSPSETEHFILVQFNYLCHLLNILFLR